MPTFIAILLIILALYCAVNWVSGLLAVMRGKLTLDDMRWQLISENMFHHGICGIVALGFAGMILAFNI